MTCPWILCIAGCLTWFCICLLVVGICCSVAWANLLVWVPGQRLGWCWCFWFFFKWLCWAVEISLCWIGCQYHYFAAFPLVFEIYSGMGYWCIRLLSLPFLAFPHWVWGRWCGMLCHWSSILKRPSFWTMLLLLRWYFIATESSPLWPDLWGGIKLHRLMWEWT